MYIKEITNREGLREIASYPIDVVNNINKIVVILNENYGEERDIDNDLGGYLLIAENIVDIEILK